VTPAGRRRLGAAALLAVSAGVALADGKKAPRWEPIGLSGGGAMFSPAISPVDPNLMMLNCDMSAAYVSLDGGASWRMIHRGELGSNTRCRPAFHPQDAKVVVAANGDSGLKVSRDKGERWEALGKLPGAPRGEVAIDPGHADSLFVGSDDGAFRSQDGGSTWAKCDGPTGEGLAFHFDLTTPVARRTVFAATKKGIWRSDDGGDTWAPKTKGLPAGGLRSFAGGSSAKAKLVRLYCATPCELVDGALAGGLYRSLDRGDSWESAMGEGLNKETKAFDAYAQGPIVQYHQVLTSNVRPETIYAFNANTGIPPPHQASVYRSDDAGRTWQATFQGDPRYPGVNLERDYTVSNDHQFYQGVPNGVAGSATNPDVVVFVDDGRCTITTDGGRTWKNGHTRLAPGASLDEKPTRWSCNGLVVTSTWNYFIDPFDPARHSICYTDIGFARSLDHGKTWSWWEQKGRSPWGNTCYELAFDPKVPGRVWGAFSNVHDIPNGNIINKDGAGKGPGGVCASADAGATWTKSNAGLPVAPCLSVVVDPRSPVGSRVLYAGVFGHGVFRSVDDGATWTARSEGLGSRENRRVVRVVLHADGTLFALVTGLKEGKKFLSDGVGLYRSKDAGATWELANRSKPLLWPKDFAVDPKDSRVIYVGACDTNGVRDAGLYRTKDGGASWDRLARQGSEHFGAYLHPKKRGWIYMTLCEGPPGAGLWLSKDDGATFTPMNGLPFGNAQRVTFDPADEGVIYVTTFGGSVWRGPASE
jgi:photosystem II stability/assembly factor-like uncharacterized protein